MANKAVIKTNPWAVILKRAYKEGIIDETGLAKVKLKRLSKPERDEIVISK